MAPYQSVTQFAYYIDHYYLNPCVSPACPQPNSALTVHKSGPKHCSSIHPKPLCFILQDSNPGDSEQHTGEYMGVVGEELDGEQIQAEIEMSMMQRDGEQNDWYEPSISFRSFTLATSNFSQSLHIFDLGFWAYYRRTIYTFQEMNAVLKEIASIESMTDIAEKPALDSPSPSSVREMICNMLQYAIQLRDLTDFVIDLARTSSLIEHDSILSLLVEGSISFEREVSLLAAFSLGARNMTCDTLHQRIARDPQGNVLQHVAEFRSDFMALFDVVMWLESMADHAFTLYSALLAINIYNIEGAPDESHNEEDNW